MSVHDLCLQLAEKEVERMKKEEEVIRLKIQIKPIEKEVERMKKEEEVIRSKIQIKSDTLDSPIPPSATAGSKKSKGSKSKTVEICQKRLKRGWVDGDCCFCVVSNPSKDKIGFAQCGENVECAETALCGKHHKLTKGFAAHDPAGGVGCRVGRLAPDKMKITAESFGSAEYLASQVTGHQDWVKRVLHSLQK